MLNANLALSMQKTPENNSNNLLTVKYICSNNKPETKKKKAQAGLHFIPANPYEQILKLTVHHDTVFLHPPLQFRCWNQDS